MPNKIAMIGKTFGHWMVLEERKSKSGRPEYLCRCVCGVERWVNGVNLRNGRSKCCGCIKPRTKVITNKENYGHLHTEETKEKLRECTIRQYKTRPYEAAFNTLVSNAKRRNLECDLTYEDYLSFTQIKFCTYCGAEVFWVERSGHKWSQKQNLDRRDNTKGYLKTNLTVCCWRCNNIKRNHFTYEQFIEIGKLIRLWGFPNSTKGFPSYLNCAFCPSQTYLQKASKIPGFNEYVCVLKHRTYIRIESEGPDGSKWRNVN